MGAVMRGRLLSPNEAKFWLLDWVAPMNCVIVVERTEPFTRTEPPRHFKLPVAEIDARSRPRWVEADQPGVITHEAATVETDWLEAATRLLDRRVGSAGHPPWAAIIQHHPDRTTLLLAVNHALTDWRTSLHVAHAFLADADPGPMAPACEEVLPASVFGAADADDLIDAWWSSRASARWHATGLDGLTAILPRADATRFSLQRLSLETTGLIQARCEADGVSLNGAVAIALRDAMGLAAVAHSVGMERFVRPALPAGPGVAVAHVFTPLGPGPFWDAARDNRAALFTQIRDGAAGDTLLALPRLLLGAEPRYQPAVMTITGAPTVGTRGAAEAEAAAGIAMQLVLSSARGGGGIMILSYHRGCLQLIAGTPASLPDVPLQAVIDRLLAACDASSAEGGA
jgi:hypothetical protein